MTLHKIPPYKLSESKLPDSYTAQEKRYLKLVTLNDKTEVTPIGSFTFKIQRYPSDIDINEMANYSGSLSLISKEFVKDIKRLVRKISSHKSNLFSDFKAGIDKKGESIHWTKSEVLNGVKILNGKKYLLKDAVTQKSVIKLDYFVRLKDRYVEMSMFFLLTEVDPEGEEHFINLSDSFLTDFPSMVMQDIIKYAKVKPFKAVKRLWSLSRYTNDIEMLKKLAPLLNSNLSLLAQINADIETVNLMIMKYAKKKALPKNVLSRMIDGFKSRLSTVLDIPLDETGLDEQIDNAVYLFGKKQYKAVISQLEEIEQQLLGVINSETDEYLKSIKLILPTK